MRWAFWRGRPSSPQRPLPEDVGLPTTPRWGAARPDPDRDDDHPPDHPPDHPAPWTSGASPTADPTADLGRGTPVPLTVPAPDLDRTALAAAGADVVRLVGAAAAGTTLGDEPDGVDGPVLAVAATGALAARLPALSGVDGAGASDEPADDLLHAYADLLAARAGARRTAAPVDRKTLLAVAHVAAAAAAVDAADDPALLLLAEVPAGAQLRAAALLLAQTADDGGGDLERLGSEVGHLFAPQG